MPRTSQTVRQCTGSVERTNRPDGASRLGHPTSSPKFRRRTFPLRVGHRKCSPHAEAIVRGDVADQCVMAGREMLDGEGARAAGLEVGVARLTNVAGLVDLVGSG